MDKELFEAISGPWLPLLSLVLMCTNSTASVRTHAVNGALTRTADYRHQVLRVGADCVKLVIICLTRL